MRKMLIGSTGPHLKKEKYHTDVMFVKNRGKALLILQLVRRWKRHINKAHKSFVWKIKAPSLKKEACITSLIHHLKYQVYSFSENLLLSIPEHEISTLFPGPGCWCRSLIEAFAPGEILALDKQAFRQLHEDNNNKIRKKEKRKRSCTEVNCPHNFKQLSPCVLQDNKMYLTQLCGVFGSVCDTNGLFCYT